MERQVSGRQAKGGQGDSELDGSQFIHQDAATSVIKASQAPKFDRELWRRFCLIAKIYFYRKGSAAGMARCITAMLLGTVGGSFWFVFCTVELTLALGPPHLVPGGFSGLSAQLNTQPYPVVAAAALAIAGAVFFAHRRQLEGIWHRWIVLATLFVMLFVVSGVNVAFSYIFRGLENNLHEKNEDGFYAVIFRYGMLLVFAIPFLGVYSYTRQMLGRNWRQSLTEYFLLGYLVDRAYYKLDSNSKNADIDNPDQRIAEDINNFTSEALELLFDILNSATNFFSFSAILWFTSQRLVGSLVLYAVVGTALSLFFGQKLMVVLYKQLRCEADFRYSLVRIRDNAEAIAFYAGEPLERSGSLERFRNLVDNYTLVMVWSILSTLYKNSFFYLARLVPYMVIGGLYFAGDVDFGTLAQATLAFNIVLQSVTIIITDIKIFSKFTASINRLGAFHDAINGVMSPPLRTNGANEGHFPVHSAVQLTDVAADQARDDKKGKALLGESLAPQRRFERVVHTREQPGADTIELVGLTVETPTHRILVENLNLTLALTGGGSSPAAPSTAAVPRRLLIVGPSGIGKSSLLRVIAGLWSRGCGEVRRPPTKEMFFLPQKPYMPLGDLRTQLLYPDFSVAATDRELSAVLGHLGLSNLEARFARGYNEVQDWARVLSGGEQQRLAAARCLLASPAPALVVLDEATSAMPVSDESILYGLLGERGLSYISVGHRETLAAHHDLVLQIGDGSWRLLTPSEYRQQIEK